VIAESRDVSEARIRRIVEVIAVGALLAVAAFLALGPTPTSDQWTAILFFSFFGFIASTLTYRISGATSGNIGFLPWLSAAIISPNAAALVAVAGSALLAEVVARRPLIKVIFNAAQHVFAVAIGVLLYLILGGRPLLESGPRIVPFVALVLTYFGLNKLAVSTIVSTAQGGTTRSYFMRSVRGSLLYDVLSIPLVLVFAVAYSRFGPAWSTLLALPMLGIRQLYMSVFALQKVNEDLLQLMVASIEARDPYTSGHSQRVARYARFIATAAGLNDRSVERTATAALLHDVGKIHEEFAVILRKPGRLTNEEFDVMKTHPVRSAELVGRVSQFADLVAPVRSHHEAWNGAGYPDQLKGEEIPLAARIIAIADTIDAMTTSRPYRAGMTSSDVMGELRRQSGIQFDPRVCEALLRPARWDQMTSEIAFANAEFPAISLATDQQGRTGEYKVLTSQRQAS
jgi:HD superfamily phosphohydrolase YqeK